MKEADYILTGSDAASRIAAHIQRDTATPVDGGLWQGMRYAGSTSNVAAMCLYNESGECVIVPWADWNRLVASMAGSFTVTATPATHDTATTSAVSRDTV